jgi:hypothetical protein
VEQIQHQRHAQEVNRLRKLDVKRNRDWVAAEERAIAYQRAAPARAARRREAELRKKRLEDRSKARFMTNNAPEPLTARDYMDSLRECYPPIEDPVKRSKHIAATLASIPRLDHMNAGVGLPSGHSGISDDPVLVKYNQDLYVNDVLSAHQNYQAFQRQQQEAEQRKAAEKEAERQRKAVLLDYHWSKYEERVAQLLRLGPVFSSHMAYLLGALDEGNPEALRQVAHALINDVLNPADSILENMKKDIMLETMGAQDLKGAWPLSDVDRILNVLDDQLVAQLPDIAQPILDNMLQGLQTICQPVLEAKVFESPLAEQQPHAFEARPIAVTFVDFANKNSQQGQQPLQGLQNHQSLQFYQGLPSQQALSGLQLPPAQQQTQATAALAGDNAGKNFSSFADLTKATKDANQPQQIAFAPSKAPGSFGIGPSSTAAPQQIAFAPSKAPGSFGISANTSTSQTPQVLGLLMYINNNILDFQDNVKSFLKEGKISVSRREDIEKVLKGMIAQVPPKTLTANDAPLMKRDVDRLITMIGNMKNAKEQKKETTRNLQVLAHKARGLWQ